MISFEIMIARPDNKMANSIRQVFQKSGLSIKALADRSGCPYATAHGFVHGTSDPTLSTANRLCGVLGLELREVKRSKAKGG